MADIYNIQNLQDLKDVIADYLKTPRNPPLKGAELNIIISKTIEFSASSLEASRAINNILLGDINFNGNQGINISFPTSNGHIANKQYADQKETNAKNYADQVATDVLRYAGTWDASIGSYPTSGTGTSGAIRRGDSYDVSVAGTIDGMDFEIGDQLRARVADPGQTASNWGTGQVNSQQATELKIGIARVATEVETLEKLSDTEIVTPAKAGALIAEEKKWFQFQVALTREIEQAILMEFDGQINSSLLGGCNSLKLKIGNDSVYPSDVQNYPFTFFAGDRVFFTFNYDDSMFAKCNIILKGKYN